jgi:UDP-N-acetylmuramyl pentapeptide phosphotransferase/UDP-N-acetylglucosamine-1-phosphate transferase
MDINYLLVVVFAILVAIVYGLLGLFDAWAKGEPKDPARIIATIIYSIIIGIILAQTGALNLTTINWDVITQVMNPVWYLYIGVLYAIQKLVNGVFSWLGWKKGLAQLFTPKGR